MYLHRYTKQYIFWTKLQRVLAATFSHLPKGKRCQRPIRLVTGHISHRCPPKIVLEDMTDRIYSQHVLVHRHRGYIIVHKITSQTVQITPDRHTPHKTIQWPSARLFFPSSWRAGIGAHSSFHFTRVVLIKWLKT